MKTKNGLLENNNESHQVNEQIRNANRLFEQINSGELDHRIKANRQEVSNFLESFHELKEIDIYKYSVLLGFTHAYDVVL